MTVATATAPGEAPRISRDKRFRGAGIVATLALLIMVGGFWPSTFGPFGPPDLLRAVHGAFAATWMTMFVAQAWLIEYRQRAVHRVLGWASIVVAPGLLASAFLTVRDSLIHGSAAHFPRYLLLLLTWLDLWSLLLFAGLYVAAIAYRKRAFLHTRLIASTVFVAIIPALGRVYGENIPALGGLTGALHPSFWTCEAILLVLAIKDARKRRWASPWWITLAALTVLDVTMFSAPSFGWFVHLCEAIGLPATA